MSGIPWCQATAGQYASREPWSDGYPRPGADRLIPARTKLLCGETGDGGQLCFFGSFLGEVELVALVH